MNGMRTPERQYACALSSAKTYIEWSTRMGQKA